MEKLKFGRPNSAIQAMIRLPTPNHPDYWKIQCGPIEHLAHLNKHLTRLVIEEPTLYRRWVPLNLEDMKLLESLSFRRKFEDILTIQWQYIRSSSHWQMFFPTGSSDYRWWQITKMVPELEIPPFTLVCVESNSHFSSEKIKRHFDDFSEFNLLLLNPKELTSLKEELSRR